MAAEYTRVYTYTGQAGWTVGRRSVALSKFKVSGDTAHNIGQIISMRYVHTHASSSSRNYTLRGRLVLADGSTIDSDAAFSRISEKTDVRFTNTFSALPSAAQFAQVVSVQTIIDGADASSDGHLTWIARADYPMKLIITFVEEPPTRYAPAIEKFDVVRVNAAGFEDDSDAGIYIAATMKLNLAADAPVKDAKLYLYKSNRAEIGSDAVRVDLSSRIPALISGVEKDTGIITGQFSPGANWYFALEFSIGDEYAMAADMIQRSFVTLHLSRCSTGGVAVGMYSTAEEGSPRLESLHPAYFYGGISQIGEGWTLLAPAAGTTPAEYGGGALRCRKIENKCMVAGSVLVKPGSSTVILAQLPDGYTPASGVFSMNACSGARIARIAVGGGNEENAGKLGLSWVRNLSDGSLYTDGTIWIQCSIEYWVDE